MGRLSELRTHVNYELEMIPDAKTRIGAVNHLYGVSLAAAILAKKRGLDSELLPMAAMLHDLYAYKHGTYEDHAHKGAELAREILEGLALTSPEETDAICSAIFHHDDKAAADGPMEEALKDADVLHHCLNDASKAVKDREKTRYEALSREFGFQ